MSTKQAEQRSGNPLLVLDLKLGEDLPGAGDDALGCLDDLLRRALRPPRDVGEAVAAGVDAGAGEDEKRDALRFDLGSAATAGRVFASIVEERVGEFVGQRLSALDGLDIVANPNGLCSEVRSPVGAMAVTALETEAKGMAWAARPSQS